MSLLDIEDHDERDRVIADYLQTRRRIQQRNEDDRTAGLTRRRELSEHFAPVVNAQREITESIKNLTPTTPEVKLLGKRKLMKTESSPMVSQFGVRVMNNDPTLDTSFGIRYAMNGRPYMGSKPISIDDRDGDIIIEGQVYNGTPGLWSLVTDTNPK